MFIFLVYVSKRLVTISNPTKTGLFYGSESQKTVPFEGEITECFQINQNRF